MILKFQFILLICLISFGEKSSSGQFLSFLSSAYADTGTDVTKEKQGSQSSTSSPYKIFIDPGHGGKDPGAYVDGIKESEITFKTSKFLEKKLTRLGYEVSLSRESDTESVPLRSRVRKAHEWGADIVLSIHANSSTHKQLRGAEFFVDNPFKPNSEDYEDISATELSQRETLRWDFVREIKEENSSLKTSLATIEKIDQFEKSHQLAQSLSSLWQVHKLPSGREKSLIFTSPLFMLKHSPIPTVLIELGYISHPIEQEILISEEEQKKFADKIAKGLIHFLDKHSLR